MGGVAMDLLREALVHLWQTTVIIAPVVLLAKLASRAPGRIMHVLWGVALFKLFIPIRVIERLTPDLLPRLRLSITPGDRHILSLPLSIASAVFDPADRIAAAGDTGIESIALITLSLWGAITILGKPRSRTHQKSRQTGRPE